MTRYLYSCGSMHTSLYVCMCISAISMVHSVTTRLRLVQKMESELVLTLHQHKYKSPKYLCRGPSCSTVKSICCHTRPPDSPHFVGETHHESMRWQETGDTQDAMWSCSQSIGLISVKPRMFNGFLCMYAMIS